MRLQRQYRNAAGSSRADPTSLRCGAEFIQCQAGFRASRAHQILLFKCLRQHQRRLRFRRQRRTCLEASQIHGIQDHREAILGYVTLHAERAAKIIDGDISSDLGMGSRRLELDRRAMARKHRGHIREGNQCHQGGRDMLQMHHIGTLRQQCQRGRRQYGRVLASVPPADRASARRSLARGPLGAERRRAIPPPSPTPKSSRQKDW